MPNSILRDGILHSERVNKLSYEAEIFYRRLMSVVDDYGRYYAKTELLRSSCFPLRIDKISNGKLQKCLDEAISAGLLATYNAKGGKYLEVIDFNQQIRAKKSKYPDVINYDQMISDDHLDVVEDVVDTTSDSSESDFNDFWKLYPKKDALKKARTTFLNLTKEKQRLAIEDIKTRYVSTDKQFVPLPTTYLNGERWNDERLTSVTNDPASKAI